MLCLITLCSITPAAMARRKLLTSSAQKFETSAQFVDAKLDPLPTKRELRRKPVETTLYEYDSSKLDGRAPLLLVHGLRGEYHQNFRWTKLIKELKANQEIDKKFKFYLIRYDTTEKLNITVPQFRHAIAKLHFLAGNKPITVMALSMGGNLVFEAMLDRDTDQKIKTFMALGTPFHGSPLFCTDWLQYGVYKNLCWPWTRIDHSLAYRWYFNHNPVLMTDLRWDNADRAVPEIGKFKSRLPFGPRGFLSVANTENQRLLELTRNSPEKQAAIFDKKKVIAYGGFLMNPYLQPLAERFIESKIMAPYTLVTVKFPAHLAREHPVLKMLNKEITTVVCSKDAVNRAGTRFVYGLNDGITPLQSALFLPNSALATLALSKETDLNSVKSITDVGKARVFKNIDHLTFIDGYHPLGASTKLRDELNPSEGAQHIFQWIADDLIDSVDGTGRLAREGKPQAMATPQD